MNALTRPRPCTDKLCDFLQIPRGTLVNRAEVNRAITAYIKFVPLDSSNPRVFEDAYQSKLGWAHKLNPGFTRNLQHPQRPCVIIPDQALSDLLDYPDYVRRVNVGKVKFLRRTRDGGTRYEVQTDPELNYSVLQHLLAKHFSSVDVSSEDDSSSEGCDPSN